MAMVMTQQDFQNAQRASRKRKLIFGFGSLIAIAVIASAVSFAVLGMSTPQRVASKTVTALISKGDYKSIKTFTATNFLNGEDEKIFNGASQPLTKLKGYDIRTVSTEVSKDGAIALVSITPVHPEQSGNSSFMAIVKLKKENAFSYKVTSLKTDYGRASFGDEGAQQ